jgi:aspartate carbamoyltransferase regulatory subunit
MNNKELNIALGKLFNGIELDTHKVELGSIDDFDNEFGQIIDKDIRVSNDLIDDLRKAEVATKKLKNDYEKVLKIGKKLEADAKDLGVDLPQRTINQIRSAEIEIKNKTTVINKIKSMYNIDF